MKDFVKNRLFDVVFPFVPKNDLSHWVGRVVHHRFPGLLGPAAVKAFAKHYNINMSEAEFPISQYATIGDLFTRRLKEGARPIDPKARVVHPADAQITEAGRIEKLTLIQAKGKDYRVDELLRSPHFAEIFEGGAFFTYYLCPTDYHRVHSSVDAKIIWSCHVPGELWPVNSWSVNAIPNLFSSNERVVIMLETEKGRVALVMVAATNVGNMVMSFDPAIQTGSRRGERKMSERKYEPTLPINKGDELGLFKMGSTVIALYEKGVLDAVPEDYRGRHVKMGQGLI